MLSSEENFCRKDKLLLLRNFKEQSILLNPRRGPKDKMKNHGGNVVILRIENTIVKTMSKASYIAFSLRIMDLTCKYIPY